MQGVSRHTDVSARSSSSRSWRPPARRAAAGRQPGEADRSRLRLCSGRWSISRTWPSARNRSSNKRRPRATTAKATRARATPPGSPTATWDSTSGPRLTAAGRTEHVLADLKGPGAITRFWSANPDRTNVTRFYFDGEAEPRLALPLADLFKGLGEPFGPDFSYISGTGGNLYFPLPYAASLKITVEETDRPLRLVLRGQASGRTKRAPASRRSIRRRRRIGPKRRRRRPVFSRLRRGRRPQRIGQAVLQANG